MITHPISAQEAPNWQSGTGPLFNERRQLGIEFGELRIQEPDPWPAVPPPSSADAREGAGCWIGPLGGVVMRAVVGDRLRVHGRAAGTSDQTSEIIEVRGPDGAPPYLVRHDDGQESLVFPGSDALVEHPQGREQT